MSDVYDGLFGDAIIANATAKITNAFAIITNAIAEIANEFAIITNAITELKSLGVGVASRKHRYLS
ncbi:MAG: hypothetical protein V7K40_22560 [Nostoc sp.]|uniref:hypothetical protein n=1 Tax=Nostoc sp. TaxID=1180 RepID=UPI002FF8A9AA